MAIDYNAALANAVAGLAALPASFYEEGCPDEAGMQNGLFEDSQAVSDMEAKAMENLKKPV